MPQMPPQRKAGFPVMLRQFDKQILYNPSTSTVREFTNGGCVKLDEKKSARLSDCAEDAETD